MESLSVHDIDPQTEPGTNDNNAILSCDDAESRGVVSPSKVAAAGQIDGHVVSRDPPVEGVGARPKTTKTLQRKNTPAVLPKVSSLYSELSCWTWAAAPQIAQEISFIIFWLCLCNKFL